MTDSTSIGDIERSLRLMWRDVAPERRSRGPKPGFTATDIVATAMAIADRAGLRGLSMRAVAEELGVGVMSLYNHVPSKAELLDVMTDEAFGELYPGEAIAGTTWRERLAAVGQANWELCLRHPWLVEVSTVRPPLGPGSSRKYELELQTIEGEGFTDLDMDSAVALVCGHALASARLAIDARRVAEQTTMSDAEWWAVAAPFLASVMNEADYPISGRVGQAAGMTYDSAVSPERAFAFGLTCILDGLASLRERTR